jgi:STE24 endopeptidase
MEPLFTPEQLADIHAYHQPYYLRAALEPLSRLVLSVLLLAVFVKPLFRGAEASAAALEKRFGFLRTAPVGRAFSRAMDRLWGEPGWGAALLFALFIDLALHVLYGPANVYFYYVLEHRYGMSNTTPALFAWMWFKGILVGAVALSSLVVGLYGLARRVPRWWLVLGVPVALLMLVASALDPYRARLYFDQSPLPEGPLRSRITALMRQADISFSDVVVEKTSVSSKRIQAYFAGQGPTRTIVLNDVILQELQEDEILAAVAHEAGHVNEARWPGRVVASLAVVALLFCIDQLLRLSARRGWWGVQRPGDIRTLPLVSFMVFVLMNLVAPASGALSREREREADRYGLALTGDPVAFRRMLVKAARVNKMDPEPPRWVVLKGMSHPPIGERIATLDAP